MNIEKNDPFETVSTLACKYDGEWGDCDPFKMIKIKEERLITGGAECQVDFQELEIFLTKWFHFRRGRISQSHVQEQISHQVTDGCFDILDNEINDIKLCESKS